MSATPRLQALLTPRFAVMMMSMLTAELNLFSRISAESQAPENYGMSSSLAYLSGSDATTNIFFRTFGIQLRGMTAEYSNLGHNVRRPVLKMYV